MSSRRADRLVYVRSEYHMDPEASALLLRAERLHQKRQFEQASFYFQELLRRYPSCTEALDRLQALHQTSSNDESGRVHPEKSICPVSDFRAPGTLVLLEVTRHPSDFKAALLEGPELQNCRDRMATCGLQYELACGAKAFVHVHEYPLVVCLERELSIYHVVVSEDLENCATEAIKKLPCRSKVRIRKREVIYKPPSEVRHTFIHVSERAERNATSVIQSSGSAHAGVNPRRVDLNRVAALLVS